MSIGLLFLPLFFLALRPGSSIAATSTSSSASTSAACAPFYIHWSDLITNVEVLEQAEVSSIEAMILKYQLRWAGHVSRLEDHRLPKIVLFGELSSGHRDRGAPTKRFKDNLKKSLTACNIDHGQWSNLAADHVPWRHTIHQAAAQFKVDRKNSLKDKRQRRKTCAASTTTPNIFFPAVTAHGPISPASVWSAISAPAVDVNVDKLLKSSFAKPSHDSRRSLKFFCWYGLSDTFTRT